MWPVDRQDRSEPEPTPPESWLAAYVDGELGEEERTRVEAWLDANPAARAAVESQRRLQGWFEATAGPEPDARAWDDTLARVEAALLPAGPGVRPTRRGPWRTPWLWAVGLATAAAVLLALWIGHDHRKTPAPGPGPEEGVLEVVAEADVVIDDMDPADAAAVVVGRRPASPRPELGPGETLPVTDIDDVMIISMDAADTAALVVGEPPVSGELVLVSQGEVQVDHMAPSPVDDTTPYLHSPKDGWPMVVAPRKAARAGD